VQSSAELSRFSDEYKIAHQEIAQASRDILSTIAAMVGRSAREAETAQLGARSVQDLTGLVDSTVLEEKSQLKTVSTSSEIGGNLSDMVEFFDKKAMGLKAIGENVNRTGAKIGAMSEYSEKIRSIIGIIDEISTRTNLLAFNAAIEASHAGDSGKGFKVIAGEIRNLADKSMESTGSVSALIADMLRAIQESIGSITATKEIADEQVRSITEASAKLKELSERLLATMRDVQTAADRNIGKILRMKESATGMNQVLSESSKASTENSAAIEVLNANFEEIGAEIEDMNTRTKQLGDIVLVLKGIVSQFNTG
jgi:methyl-accepting chemotaxis protein